MERMWRKVNHSFSGRTSKTISSIQSSDTVSSAGGFGDGQIVVAVAGIPAHNNNNSNAGTNLPSSTATGRRLAASGQLPIPGGAGGSHSVVTSPGNYQKSLSQHVLQSSTASSERRRRRRRKSRPRRSGGISCVGGGGGGGGGGDNMSSSGGFYSIRESSGGSSHRRHRHQQHRHHQHHPEQQPSSAQLLVSSAPSGTMMMEPQRGGEASTVASSGAATLATAAAALQTSDVATTSTSVAGADISLRQRAVAKLRMFNFHLNWDLHMTHCKPCGPRLGSGSSGGSGGGNIITRRLCRNRRREDNELYRSNSFKFERFERKDCVDELTDTLQKQIAICDDYSLPVDFVKKRPSSFDPNLAEALPTNPENWTAPSPQSEFIALADPQLQQQQQPPQQHQQQHQHPQQQIPLPPPPPPSQQSTAAPPNVNVGGLTTVSVASCTLPGQTHQQHQQHQQQQHRQHSIQLKTHNQRRIYQQQQQPHPPLPTTIKKASVKLIEGYSDPKDSKRQKKVYHKKIKRRHRNSNTKKQAPHKQQDQQQIQQQQLLQQKQQQDKQIRQQQQQQNQEQQQQPSESGQAVKQGTAFNNNSTTNVGNKDKHSNYSSDSSAPKSSDVEELAEVEVEKQCAILPELNSPDSISDDLVQPLPPNALHRSPRKLNAGPSDTSKRNPSPYYYSDLLKPKEVSVVTKEAKLKSRQSTVSEPPQLSHTYAPIVAYRKSTSLDVPSCVDCPEDGEAQDTEEAEAEDNENANGNDYDENDEDDEFEEETEPTTHNTVLAASSTPKRYSFTEDGVRIIRCDSPSTSTSDDSDCSECQKRREWHARALALVRKTCNVQPLISVAPNTACDSENLKCGPFDSENSMPPHRLLGPAVCACVTPAIGDDIDEYFRPRSIFYVHPQGVHECADCSADSKCFASADASRNTLCPTNQSQSDNTLERNYDNEDDMAGRRRQIYETAFDCKIAKSDDDLDEVDRITNHSVLLQLSNGNNLPPKASENRSTNVKSHAKSRLEGKRLKNSKNQAIQEKASNSGSNVSGSGSPHRSSADNNVVGTADPVDGISTKLENTHLRDQQVDQQNNSTTSTSQLPLRGYTPSPPSTAPLPMKFPGKHERFFMNSIKSAPNLPSTNPAHPRLRDLRLPIQSSLRQHHQLGVSSLGTSNENSLTDSAYANPPSSAHHMPAKPSSRARDRPRSFVLESGRVLELRRSHAAHHHNVGNGGRRQHNYSSTESIATSSSGGSMESLRSSTSEGNRSTSSSESRHSTSLSSHSSESGSSSAAFPLRAPVVIHSKLHILSPISDKSSQEPASDLSEQNKTQNATPEDGTQKPTQSSINSENIRPFAQLQIDPLKRRRAPPNKTLLHLADEILGSDSGISLHSREDGKTVALTAGLQKFTLPKLNFPSSDKANDSDVSAVGGIGGSVGLPQDLRDLPFDMPKLRRRKTIQQDACTSGSATSVDLRDLPFDMPKLRRRLRANQVEINNLIVHSTESSGISQASSSHSMREENKTNIKLDNTIFRQNLTLNLNEPRPANKFGSLDLRGMSTNKELNLNLAVASGVDLIDVSIPLERQGWYHGAITRVEAETMLRPLSEGSFLVRNCESTKQDYSLSLKGAKGFMHMRIQRNDASQYILGQFSRPFDTVPEMIRHFCLNRLPVRGAEHMCLIEPVIAQLL